LKKKLLVTLSFVLVIMVSLAVGAYAATDIKLFINGKLINADLQIVDGSSYVPLRVVSESLGAEVKWDGDKREINIVAKGSDPNQATSTYKATLNFPADKYPETAAHIKAAIAKGESAVCTIDRTGADQNREESLKGIPTKEGYDRDEWPMAMCAEGGTGADIEYVTPTDNRGAGSWVSNQLQAYTDGTRVLFVIDGGASPDPTPGTSKATDIIYTSCTQVKAAGKAPIHRGDPGYSTNLDRDGDGVACEG
jgi:hypothetical protein